MKFKIKNLQGNCQIFDNLDANITINNLKHIIINNHNGIKELFSPKLLKDSNILLFQNSIELSNDMILQNLNNNIPITYSIISDSININTKEKTLFNNYKISPCSIDNRLEDDVFMDAFEGDDDTMISVEKLINDIRLDLKQMIFFKHSIEDKLNAIEKFINKNSYNK